MPAYFYHLSFELFQPSSTQASSETRPDSGSASYRSRTASVQETAPHGRELTVDPSFRQRLRDVLPEAEAIPASPPPSEAQLSLPLAPADWRFGLISVESFNMAPPTASLRRSTTSAAQNPPSQRHPAGGAAISEGVGEGAGGGGGGVEGRIGGVGGGGASAATKGKFISLTPENADLGWGIVHLYRDGAETPGLYDDDSWKTPGLASSGVGSGAARTSPPRHHRCGHQQQQPLQQQQQQQWNDEDCTTLCILAVPSYLTPFDLLGFVGEKTINEVTHIRMIRTERVNRYMALLKFRSATTARQWRKEWNGKPFNSVEPEYCLAVFVKSIRYHFSEDGGSGDNHNGSARDAAPSSSGSLTYPNLANDPLRPPLPPPPPPPSSSSFSSSSYAAVPTPSTSASAHTSNVSHASHTRTRSTLSAKPAAPPTPSLVELPTCPVCLERMDDVTTGLLTILCQHVFHCACLQKWRGSGCPVCRYTQADGLLAVGGIIGGGSKKGKKKSKKKLYGIKEGLRSLEYGKYDGAGADADDAHCGVCGSEANLWICLICGNVGCGRYDGAHAIAHYDQTAHAFAMDLATQRVWDYAGDGYVHRLVENRAADGKLVELPGPTATSNNNNNNNHKNDGDGDYADGKENNDDGDDDSDVDDDADDDDADALGLEYTHLLRSQLESQRLYYEQKVAQAADKAARAAAHATEQAAAAQAAAEREHASQQQLAALRDGVVPQLERDVARAERRGAQAAAAARRLEQQWRDEQALSASLLGRVAHLDGQLAALRGELRELEEQNRDLGFFISAQARLGELGARGEDVQGGSVSLPPAPAAAATAAGGGKSGGGGGGGGGKGGGKSGAGAAQASSTTAAPGAVAAAEDADKADSTTTAPPTATTTTSAPSSKKKKKKNKK